MSNATTADVLAGTARWSCVASKAEDFLPTLPDDSIDLLITSPPYEDARTYGIDGGLPSGQAWVDWMHRIVCLAAPKVRGLIAINCEGRTRDYRYSCVPFLLVADLHRAGFNMRKPALYCRFGIPGSGGPDWLRNDYEPIVCVTRGGRMPFSEPTACGKRPIHQTGGAMSNRTADGRRINQAKGVTCGNGRRANGVKNRKGEPGCEKRRPMPEIANPGNLIRCVVGGGSMGHPLATENEAPFPLKLAAFFVKSFCPPGGVVCDVFSGSGTTCHASIENGRRFIGCDLRQIQVELCERRMRTVTPDLFNEAA